LFSFGVRAGSEEKKEKKERRRDAMSRTEEAEGDQL
jgi:hypothetical protein